MTYEYRPARESDFPVYFDLYRRQSLEDLGGFQAQPEDIRSEWSAPGFDLPSMMLLVFADRREEEPRLVGYCEVRAFHSPPVRVYCYGYVHPDHRGRGIGTELLRRAEPMGRTFLPRTPEGSRVVLQTFSSHDDGRELLGANGYAATRESLLMDIDLVDPPDWQSSLPAGCTIRTMADGLTLEEWVAVKAEAFRDHRGAVEQPLDEETATWRHLIETNARIYDPGLFALLECDGRPAGEIAIWTESEENADKVFVQSLGVLRPFRRRGAATALLNFGFSEAIRRGKTAAGLIVDGSSLTGANRLYEKVGMRIFRRFTAFEKELRPGVEISRQE